MNDADKRIFKPWVDGIRARLRAERLALGLSFREAEERTGVPFQTITRIETGDLENPSTGVLFRLAIGYGMSPLEFPKKRRTE